MSEPKVYPIEAHGDFIHKQTYAKPAFALAELIWNSLDANATHVEIKEELYGGLSPQIVISDDGDGFAHEDAHAYFGYLGGSWKRLAGTSKGKNRFLHGSEGKGRLKALALGRVVDWFVSYKDGKSFKSFTVSMIENAAKEVRITEPQSAVERKTGVRCVISELHKAYEFLRSEGIVNELSELFATYLKNYPDVTISLPTGKLDMTKAIESSKSVTLSSITVDGNTYPFELEIIEWKHQTDRVLYLCNEAGLPLSHTDIRVQVPGLNFSAYLKSPYISELSKDGILGLGELNPALEAAIGNVKEVVKAFHKEQNAEKAKTLVDRWKDEEVYPYSGEPQTLVEQIGREVFDIVAISVNSLVPDFEQAPQKGKKFQLRMLRQAIENSPEELQIILNEVLDLPATKQKELAKLLHETTLSAMISASKVVADRLKFLCGLEAFLFSADLKKHLKERTELHRLLAENTWIFGEEFFLSVDDQSLTEVLRKHLKAKKLDIVVDEAVRRIDGSIGIVDLMLTRKIPCHREDELEHLIVELKRPSVSIGMEEISQIKSYAFAVAKDERFRSIDARWTFWIVSSDMDEFAKQDANQANRPAGMIHQSEDKRITILAKTWSEVLHANRQRLKLFQQSLEISADRESSLGFLHETYAHVLGGSAATVVNDDANAVTA